MNKLTCVFLLLFSFVSFDCRAELTYPELQHAYQASEKSNADVVDNYLVGLYEGINAANLAYYMQTKRFLYCKPNNFNLNVTNLRAIVKDAHENYNTDGTIPVSYLLFVGLRQTFPCL